MNNKDFKRMINNINGLITSADKLKTTVESKPELDDFSIKELKSMVSLARSLQGSQDKIFTQELYHVLGMADLSAAQSSAFCKKIKEFASYRHTIKYLCTYPIDTLPVAPVCTNTTEYECKVLNLQCSATFE